MWLKLDDNFYDHPKLIDLDPTEFTVHIGGLLFCARHETDGHVKRGAISRLSRRGIVDPSPAIVSLVTAGIWEETESGFCIPNFTEFNPTREQRQKQREAGRKRQAEFRARKQADAEPFAPRDVRRGMS